MPAPDRIKQLITTFEQNINDYRSNKNETELRRQFLDPFFEALGWDVDNKQGKDERHKEVAHEFSVEIDGQQKKADYAFRTEKDVFDFLVEAKKPSVNVESNKDAAFQIRSYGWSAKIPVNILTDFEHLAIYDCRIRPNYAKDDAKTGRIELIHYKDYIKRWDEIAKLFSPDAIRNGALNEYTDGLKTKKGTQEVDDAFLEEIEGWREALAKNIAARNKDKNLNEEQINFVVQMTIDRIIFLRIAEERGMEKDRRLFELIDNKNIYKDLLKFFAQADDRYNSGLFHFKKDKDRENPDTLSQSLEIEDRVLKDIIKDLYYPSPYAFTYIPTEILGSVYERFLGKVIRLTAGGNAKVEEKPEVRKAGGVYYTPSYIVEYIVKNTVGKLLEEQSVENREQKAVTPDEVSKIKIVDPACGSGSFLLGAYQFLLDWHLDYYASHSPEKWVKNKTILTADNKTYRLSIDEKKRILLNNIHGVDLDPQAVEVTKLSLLLKVVEDPGQLKMFEEGHILPNLNKNIKNGNALIGTDYFSGQMFNDMEEMKQVKPFDWQHEFPEIFKRGGFDAVIGNPPYVFGGNYGIEQDDKKYFKEKFFSGKGKINLFTLFIEKSTNILRNGGLLSYIIPNTLLRVTSYSEIREFVLKNTAIKKIVDMGVGVFSGATTSSVIIVLEKNSKVDENVVEIQFGINGNPQTAKQSNFLAEGYVLNIKATSQDTELLNKLKNVSFDLGEICEELIFGVVITKNRDEVVASQPLNGYKPFLEGKDISRYFIRPVEKYLLYKPELLHRARTPRIFEAKEKILIQRITGGSNPLNATYDNQQFYNKESINNIILEENTQYSLKYVLGLINSNLINWFYKTKFTNESTLTVNLSKEYLSQLPIRTINFNQAAEKSKHDQMVSLVEKMLALHKSLAEAKTPQEKELLQRQITSTDKAIDSLVYELYGLSEEEVRIVEG